MSRNRTNSPSLPACYAQVIPGLESVAAEEITSELGGEIKKKVEGAVVFRLDEISRRLLDLRTTEDVFLLAWGTDELSYRAKDLESIRRWTARDVDWSNLLRFHHAIRPKPKGKPTIRLVTQMEGQHGYRRIDAGKALALGLAGKLPASWKYADENASVEVWLTIHGRRALCGLRLSDRTMRHRSYKLEHVRASLRPTAAAAIVRLLQPRPPHTSPSPPGGRGRGERARPKQTVLDPLCGAGTILAELWEYWRSRGLLQGHDIRVLGGDIDSRTLRAARGNLQRLGPTSLMRWDATHLPLPNHSVDCILSNPPFGKRLERPEGMRSFYAGLVRELDRVLLPRGQAVLLVSDWVALKEASLGVGWKLRRQFGLRILGQRATLTLWQK